MEKKIIFKNFEIKYTDKDEKYIQLIIQKLKNNYLNIINFFNLEKIDTTILIKFWDNLMDYRNFFNEKMKKQNKTVAEWEVARSTNNSKEHRIELLCLEESRKCRGHHNDTVETLIKVSIHEFVHTCHFIYNENKDSMTWFAEALATNLSNQYEELCFDCSLDDILNGKANYINYYSMGRYLIDNCDKEYILELAKNIELLKNETTNIYYQTLEYVSKKRSL